MRCYGADKVVALQIKIWDVMLLLNFCKFEKLGFKWVI